MERLSLIYPNDFSNNENLIIDLESRNNLLKNNYLRDRNVDLTDFLTNDNKTIQFRHEIFGDLQKNPSLAKLIDELIPMLETINELYRIREKQYDVESQIYAIKEIIVYINFITKTYKELNESIVVISSASLISFRKVINSIAKSESFINLTKNTEKLSKDVQDIKSVTIGVNLDVTLLPYESGILSFNREYVRSGEFVDRLLSADMKNNDNQTIAPLRVTSKLLTKEEKDSTALAINSAMIKIFKSGIKEWQPVIKTFFTNSTGIFLPLLSELKFLAFGVKVLNELKSKNLPLCTPELRPMKEKAFSAKGIYNPIIALCCEHTVLNDITFDEKGMIYILTGPNSGGKSVFTCAVGICQVFAQLGFLVPAKSAVISPVDKISVHFANKATSNNKGRLGEECEELKAIFDKISEYSLVLLDETLSSTGSFEGAYIAADIISGFSAYGCRVLYATHLHEILGMIPEINALPASKSKIDTLAAGVEPSGIRSFEINRTTPAGKSYARDISNSYGLSYERILEKLQAVDFKNK